MQQITNFHLRSKLFLAFLICGISAVTASAQTYTVLHEFNGLDGQFPFGPVVQGFDGEIYGTTMRGWISGTFFKIGTNGGRPTVLYKFVNNPVGDRNPEFTLLESQFGNFYGTTYLSNPDELYRMTPAGAETIVFHFCAQPNCTDGFATTSLIWDWNHDLRGTASQGGTNGAHGTIFRITPQGTETIAHTFCRRANCADGETPMALVQASDGNFYGVTSSGGLNTSFHSRAGTVFTMGPKRPFTKLYDFCAQANCADGAFPQLLIQASDGNLYGVTLQGGASDSGTIFKITTAGVLTTLHTADGTISQFIEGSDGNFYGTNEAINTIFKITPSGTLTVLHTFGGTDGSAPTGLVQGTDGAFYGVTELGGANNFGVVFRLDAGLGPFIQPVLTFGKVGDSVALLGTNLTGSTAVSFNGTPAIINKITNTRIQTTVPSGAASGPITVITPTGTLSSNVQFTVVP